VFLFFKELSETQYKRKLCLTPTVKKLLVK